MNSLHDSSSRCIQHPHQPTVGVCASCLRERLTILQRTAAASHSRRACSYLSDDLQPPYFETSSSWTPKTASDRRRSTSSVPDTENDRIKQLVLHKLRNHILLSPSGSTLQQQRHVNASPSSPTVSGYSHNWFSGKKSRVGDRERRKLGSVAESPNEKPKKKGSPRWPRLWHSEHGRNTTSRHKRGEMSATMNQQATCSSVKWHAKEEGQPPSAASRASPTMANRSRSNANCKIPGEVLVCLDVDRHHKSSWLSSLLSPRGRRSKHAVVTVKSGGMDGAFSVEKSISSTDGAGPTREEVVLARRSSSCCGKEGAGQLTRTEMVIEEDPRRLSDIDRDGAYFSDSCAVRKRRIMISNFVEGNGSCEMVNELQSVGNISPVPMINRRRGQKMEQRQSVNYVGNQSSSTTPRRMWGVVSEDESQLTSRSRGWGKAVWSKTFLPVWCAWYKQRGGIWKSRAEGEEEAVVVRDSREPDAALQQFSILHKDYRAFSFYFNPLNGMA